MKTKQSLTNSVSNSVRDSVSGSVWTSVSGSVWTSSVRNSEIKPQDEN